VQPLLGDFGIVKIKQMLGFVAEMVCDRCHNLLPAFSVSISVRFKAPGLPLRLPLTSSNHPERQTRASGFYWGTPARATANCAPV
jgi:hypothetical protein